MTFIHFIMLLNSFFFLPFFFFFYLCFLTVVRINYIVMVLFDTQLSMVSNFNNYYDPF